MTWKPIETAPKDGTEIIGINLSTFGGRDLRIFRWDWGDGGEFDPGWFDEYEGEGLPTHWMPLPDPPKAGKPKFCAKDMELPEGINPEAWREWCEFRSSKNKPVSEKAAKKQLQLLAGFPKHIQQDVIDHSITNDYQGLFPPKGGTNGQSTKELERQRLREATTGASRNDWAEDLIR